jgi:hypothetical protein
MVQFLFLWRNFELMNSWLTGTTLKTQENAQKKESAVNMNFLCALCAIFALFAGNQMNRDRPQSDVLIVFSLISTINLIAIVN